MTPTTRRLLAVAVTAGLTAGMAGMIGVTSAGVASASTTGGGGGGAGGGLPSAAFVIGDESLASVPVEFWGAQWWKDNQLSGGAAPASFKGYAETVTGSGCAGAWSTSPGNSSHPPSRIPPVIEVIVTSAVTASGSTISGNVVGVATVATGSGYGANPGHAGRGTVLSYTPC